MAQKLAHDVRGTFCESGRHDTAPDFRKAGMTADAISYPRPAAALIALKRFNGLADDAPVPAAWGYFPNAWMRDNWQRLYGHLAADLCEAGQ